MKTAPDSPSDDSRRHALEFRFRAVLLLFLLALVLSGITAFPLVTELRGLDAMAGSPADSPGSPPQNVQQWISHVRQGLEESYAKYPFLGYGTDWLAFAHLVIAVFFIGPLLRPAEYAWTLLAGMIACMGVVVLALACGPIRGIPLYWRLIDCSFGVFGILPLLYCLALGRKLRATRPFRGSAVGWRLDGD
jgi:hypothetical protein